MYIDCHSHQTGVDTSELIRIESLRPKQIEGTLPVAYSIGLHPCYPNDMHEESILLLRELLQTYTPLAIGEAGIDKHSPVPFAIQLSTFEAQIELSEQHKLPIIIHCVRGWNELNRLHRKHKPRMPWIIHGFRKHPRLAKELLAMGLYLSFGQYAHPESIRLAFDLNRLLLETDDQTTISIHNIYHSAAQMLNINLEELITNIHTNANKVFFNR